LFFSAIPSSGLKKPLKTKSGIFTKINLIKTLKGALIAATGAGALFFKKMSRQEKIILKFLKNPVSLKFKEIEKILLSFEFEKIQGKGSHIRFKTLDLRIELVFPVHNNDCKDVYKKEAKKVIEKYFL